MRSSARQSRDGTVRSVRVRRLPLRSSCPALLGLMARRVTRFVALRSTPARTDAPSQITKRAGTRAAMSPAMLGVSHARCALPRHAFAAAVEVFVFVGTPMPMALAAGGTRRGRFVEVSPDTNSPVDCLCLANGRASGPARPARREERRSWVGARTRALRQLTRRNCLSGSGAQRNEASFSTRPETEHRSEACSEAKGRSTMSPCRVPPAATR